MRKKWVVGVCGLIVAFSINAAAYAVPVEGDTSATWENPQATCGDYHGVGTSQFNFGLLCHNYRLSFAGAHFESADIGAGEIFTFGTIEFFNAWPTLTSVSGVDLDMTLDFQVPDMGEVPYTYDLDITIRVFSNDYISLDLPLSQPDPFVFDNCEYSIEMLGFDPNSVTGCGWYEEVQHCGIDEQRLHVRECQTASINLIGRITGECQEPPGQPVPEPATIMLISTGLAGLGIIRRKRKVA